MFCLLIKGKIFVTLIIIAIYSILHSRWHIFNRFSDESATSDQLVIYFRKTMTSHVDLYAWMCLLITLTRSPKAELRRAQLNGIARMQMKGASGCRQTVMNDLGAQQPCQMFLTWVKARPHTGNSVPHSLRIVCGFFNVPEFYLQQGLWDGTSGL